jgi:hypothetical protein
LDEQEDIGEDEGDEGDRHGVELALLGFNQVQGLNIDGK